MKLLIGVSDFELVGINLPNDIELDDLKRYINEAQEFDVKSQFGDLFYYDLIKNSTSTNYQELLNADVEYTYQNYNFRYSNGLKAAICYYAYARYIPDSNKKNTDFGMMQKKNEFSDHVDSKSIQLQVNNANSAAYGFMVEVTTYLDRMRVISPTKFPLWKQGGVPGLFGSMTPQGENPSGVKITKVGNI